MTAIAPQPPTGTAGLSALVRTLTRPEHGQSMAFGSALGHADAADGRSARDAYAAMLVQAYCVYDALERAALVQAQHPIGRLFVADELTRMPALAADLEHLLGASWRERVEPLPATEDYCERLREVAYTWPAGFVAHHATRYLSDLSAAPFLRRVVHQQFGPDQQAVRFHTFARLDDPAAFTRSYLARLDAMPLDEVEHERVLAEVHTGRRLHAAVSTELEAGTRLVPTRT